MDASKAAQAKAQEFESTPGVSDFATMVKEHALADDLAWVPAQHLAGITKVQAAINRAVVARSQGRDPADADLQAVQALYQQVDQIAEQFGVKPAAAPAAPQITPLTGDLPDGYKDLVQVYGLPEKQVRLLAAIEAREKAPPAAPPASAPAAQPPTPRAKGVDLEGLYVGRRDEALAADGVPRERVRAHLQLITPQILAETRRRFPTVEAGREAAMYNALPPKEQFEITMEAHRAFKGGSRPASPPPAKPAPTRAPPSGNPASAPRRQAHLDFTGKDAVTAAVNFLASED